jgi:hypothetical protein
MVLTRLEQRVNKGRKALSLAKQKGLDAALWEKELAELERQLEEFNADYQLTIQLLATQGWCLWQCSVLDGAVIAVVRDESVKGVPEGYPVYYKGELEKVGASRLSSKSLRLIHEVKKRTAATVLSVIASPSAEGRGNLGGGTCSCEALAFPPSPLAGEGQGEGDKVNNHPEVIHETLKIRPRTTKL